MAAQSPFDEIRNIVSACPTPESGCFASDPDALITMFYVDDAVIRSEYQRIASAADAAGVAGTPLEDAPYTEVTLVETGRFPSSESTGGWGMIAEIGDGETRSVGEVLANPESIETRIAKCAYVCGQTAIGTCPIRTPAPSQPEQPHDYLDDDVSYDYWY